MTRDGLGEQVTGPIVELAAMAKEALEARGLLVKTDYGNFYVSRVELSYCHGGDFETVGYLVPDEGEGKTYDLFTPSRKDDW